MQEVLVAVRAALSELRREYDDPHLRQMATYAIEAIEDCLPWLGEDPDLDPVQLYEAQELALVSLLAWEWTLTTCEERAALKPHIDTLRQTLDSVERPGNAP